MEERNKDCKQIGNQSSESKNLKKKKKKLLLNVCVKSSGKIVLEV